MNKISGFHYTFDFGIYGFYTYKDHLAYILREDAIECEYKENETIKSAAIQLYEYSIGKRKEFELPFIKFFGDEESLRKEVYEFVMKIPYGKVVTYDEIAESLLVPKKLEVIRLFLNKNRLPIIIPCHRVVESKDDIGDYVNGRDIKNTLLQLEAKYSKEK